MTIYYAGIGSRSTPERVLDTMLTLSTKLAEEGLTLRSGGAAGADTAFENGCSIADGRKEIWLPYKGFRNRHGPSCKVYNEDHEDMASMLHPVWNRLPKVAQRLHSRNVGQILGENVFDIFQYSKFVICYTPDGADHHTLVTAKTGGTGTAIKLASYKEIPVFNLYNLDAIFKLNNFLKTLSIDITPVFEQ